MNVRPPLRRSGGVGASLELKIVEFEFMRARCLDLSTCRRLEWQDITEVDG